MKKPNLVMMCGADSFSLKEELFRWKNGFIQKHGDMNTDVLEGAKLSLGEIRSTIASTPFLAEKRLVIIKNYQLDRKADDKKALKEMLDGGFPDSTILVFADYGAPDKRSSLYKYLTKNATVKSFDPPSGAALTSWINKRIQHHGGSSDFAVAGAMGAIVGENLWSLDNEIQKLCIYANGQTITRAMVDELVTGNLDQNIFEMTDRLARKDIAGTLKLFRELHASGNEAPYLFAMVVRQFRLMIEMKVLHDKGMHPKMIASHMKVHPFVVSNTVKHCRNFSLPQLKEALSSLLEIDRRMKTGRLHFRTREEDQYLLAIEKTLINL